MLIDPIIFFVLLSTIATISIVLVVLVSSYVKMLSKYNSAIKQEERLKSQTHKEEIKILEDARQKAAKIVGNATIIDEKEKSQVEEEFKRLETNEVKEFQSATENLFTTYKEQLYNLKNNTISIAQGIVKDIENDIIKELKDFKDILKKETYESQKIVEQKIEQDYQTAKKEVQYYKQEQIKKINNEIYKILQNVSMLVLRKTIPLEDHEQLILDALNKAKEEKVFE